MSTRQIIEAQRAGYVAGARAAHGSRVSGTWESSGWSLIAERQAAELYPLPTITRPRVVVLGSGRYRINNGHMERQAFNDPRWFRSHFQRMQVEEILSLYDNPTETVEAP